MALPPCPTTLPDVLRWQAEVDPEAEALVAGGRRLSYMSWHDAATAIGQRLVNQGLNVGDSVALLLENCTAWCEIAMGAAAAGARVVPFNTWVKARDLEYLLSHAKPRILFVRDRLGRQDFMSHLSELIPEVFAHAPGEWHSARFPHLDTIVVLGENAPLGARRYSDWLREKRGTLDTALADPSEIAVVFYTSGSTATPKAVPLIHSELIVNGFNIGERQALTAKDRIFLPSPLFWAYGGGNALMATLSHGATLVMMPQFAPSQALDLIEREQCTSLYTLPAVTHALAVDKNFSRKKLATLRTGLTIGSPSDVERVYDVLGVEEICNVYGSTEMYGNSCVTPHTAPFSERLRSQGPPLPGFEVSIVGENSREPLGPGRVGEILVRGRISPGYLDESGELSPITNASGFFVTGDLGYLDEAGWVTYVGRRSAMIKTGGINVSPLEVEEFLATHHDVIEAAVVGADEPVKGQRVIAFVRLTKDAKADGDSLREYCSESIASYKVPDAIAVLDAMPLTPSGKVARTELEHLAQEFADDRWKRRRDSVERG